MDGNQKPQLPNNLQDNPVDSHPSLVEPSQLPTLPTPAPAPATQSSQLPQPVAAAPAPQPEAPPAAPSPAAARPVEPAQPSASTAAEPSADPAGGFYRVDDIATDVASGLGADEGLPSRQKAEVVTWTAGGESQAPATAWRVRMTAISLALGVVIYFITRDVFSAGAVIVAGILFGFIGMHKPHALSYQLDGSGIIIGQRHFSYTEFRAFSIADETSFPTIELMPLKRFLPVVSLQMDPALREQIVGVLSVRLPMEAHRRDVIDRLTSLIGKQ
jgi:hypothetical protein